MSDLVERLQGAYSTVFERSMAKEAADEIKRLWKERDDFYMGYRMKCDGETKRQVAEIDALRRRVEDLKESVKYWQTDSAAGWDKCEERRKEAESAEARVKELEARNAAVKEHALKLGERLDAAEAALWELMDTRAGKLLKKGKPFLVVANDEPYYSTVYAMIRQREKEIGRWTDADEAAYNDACNRRAER